MLGDRVKDSRSHSFFGQSFCQIRPRSLWNIYTKYLKTNTYHYLRYLWYIWLDLWADQLKSSIYLKILYKLTFWVVSRLLGVLRTRDTGFSADLLTGIIFCTTINLNYWLPSRASFESVIRIARLWKKTTSKILKI